MATEWTTDAPTLVSLSLTYLAFKASHQRTQINPTKIIKYKKVIKQLHIRNDF